MQYLTICNSNKTDEDGQWDTREIPHITRESGLCTLWVESAILNEGGEVYVAVGVARNGLRRGKLYYVHVNADGTVGFRDKTPKWIVDRTDLAKDLIFVAQTAADRTREAFLED